MVLWLPGTMVKICVATGSYIGIGVWYAATILETGQQIAWLSLFFGKRQGDGMMCILSIFFLWDADLTT